MIKVLKERNGEMVNCYIVPFRYMADDCSVMASWYNAESLQETPSALSLSLLFYSEYMSSTSPEAVAMNRSISARSSSPPEMTLPSGTQYVRGGSAAFTCASAYAKPPTELSPWVDSFSGNRKWRNVSSFTKCKHVPEYVVLQQESLYDKVIFKYGKEGSFKKGYPVGENDLTFTRTDAAHFCFTDGISHWIWHLFSLSQK